MYRDFASSTVLYCRLLVELNDRLAGDGMVLEIVGLERISCFVVCDAEVNARRLVFDAHCLQMPTWAERKELRTGDAILDVFDFLWNR